MNEERSRTHTLTAKCIVGAAVAAVDVDGDDEDVAPHFVVLFSLLRAL